MTPDRLEVAIEVLSNMADAATEAADNAEALNMSSTLMLAHSYLVEYYAHLARGSNEGDAMLKTMRGDLPIA